MIICISGLTGSGKTTFADMLITELEKLNYKVFHYTSDQIAQKLFVDKIADFDKNQDYTSEDLDTIYAGIYMLFGEILRANPNAVIVTDGMYRKASQRLTLKMVADKLNTPFKLIKVEIDEETAKRRTEIRFSRGGQGGWVDPKDYEDPSAEKPFKVINNGKLTKLKRQLKKVILWLGLEETYFS